MMVAAARKHNKLVAYVRVSSVDQNTERQLESIQSLSPDKIFADKCSGKDTKRPQLEAILSYVREGDTLVVHSLDRLGEILTTSASSCPSAMVVELPFSSRRRI